MPPPAAPHDPARTWWRRLWPSPVAQPSDRLTYSATSRCDCGAGLAYRSGDDFWDCSDILLGAAIPSGDPGSERHTAKLPFVFYEIKSETQPSANGATTRERIPEPPSPKPDWVVRSERNNEIVHAATGVEGHAIRCGWAVMEIAGLHADWTEEDCAKLIGVPFRWLHWPNEGAIVAAEPRADGQHVNGQDQLVRVEVWAVPTHRTRRDG